MQFYYYIVYVSEETGYLLAQDVFEIAPPLTAVHLEISEKYCEYLIYIGTQEK